MKQAPVLTDRDIKRMLQYFTRTAYPARNRCVFMLGNLAGMRIGEIAALKIGDVLTPESAVRNEIQLTAAQTKGSEARTVMLNTQLQGELENVALTRDVPSADIFQRSGPSIPPILLLPSQLS